MRNATGRGCCGRRPVGRRGRRVALALAVALAAVPGTAAAQEVGADFDGDGFGDLAVGVQLDGPEGVDRAGAVNVLYGGRRGLRSGGSRLWHQNVSGVPDVAEPGDFFGVAVAAGDFDGDGRDDLAIGAPGEDVTVPGRSQRDAGVVTVLYGGRDGLSSSGAQLLFDSIEERGTPFVRAGAGRSLAAGDFDGDGHDDLAVGAPGEEGFGVVRLAFGTPDGLTRTERLSTCLQPSRPGLDRLGCLLESGAEHGDLVGWSLAAGDLDGDGRDDLAIGMPGEDVSLSFFRSPEPSSGAVVVYYGHAGGLAPPALRPDDQANSRRRGQVFLQDLVTIPDYPDRRDRFGEALAIGDFDGNGSADLAVGAPGSKACRATRPNRPRGGEVHVISGLRGIGLVPAAFATAVVCQDTPGVGGAAEAGDRFGLALVAADFRGAGVDDLAIGVPGEDVSHRRARHANAGAVFVVQGTRGGGLDPADGTAGFDQRRMIGTEGLETGDAFGAVLGAGDFDGDGRADLAIGVPLEDLRRGRLCSGRCRQDRDAGLVNLVYGWRDSPLARMRTQLVSQASRGVSGRHHAGENFGASLTR